MKRWIWLALAAGALAAVGITLVALPAAPVWTTSSIQALEAYEAGEIALRKIYTAEAREQFERALELDPGFLVAKWRVSQTLPDEDPVLANRLAEEIVSADLSDLTPREKFVIEYWIAQRNNKVAEATRLLDDYLGRFPNDAYVLSRKAAEAWRDGRLEEAERLYGVVVKADPNWVFAYNSLGYIMKTQGRFSESEEFFKYYRYTAPDQANPHDSLGELFITIGRYEEAEASLEEAIRIKPDFWASYRNLTIMKAYSGDYAEIQPIIDRARAAGVDEEILLGMSCRASYAEMAEQGEWQRILDQRDSECVRDFNTGLSAIVTHRAACHTGDWDTAIELEDEAAAILAEAETRGDLDVAMGFRAAVPHMRGVRLAIRGNFEEAEKHLRTADDRLGFIGTDLGMYKLYNRLLLAESMLAGGKTANGHQLIADVRRVNPAMVDTFQDSGFRILGLQRGVRSASAPQAREEVPAL